MTQNKILVITSKKINPQDDIQEALKEYASWKIVSVDTQVSTGKTLDGFQDGLPTSGPKWIWYTVTILLTKD